MTHAPKDGTRILLHYNTRHSSCQITGTKWEECRFISDKETTGSEPHWEPWNGNEKIRTTHHISPEDALEWRWLPLGAFAS